MDLRFVLQSPNGKYTKVLKPHMHNGVKRTDSWAKKEIPQEWIDEKPTIKFFG